MSESFTLSQVLERYRSLTPFLQKHYRELNVLIKYESRFVLLFPLAVVLCMQILQYTTSHVLISIFGAIWTTVSLSRLVPALLARHKLETRHGIVAHQRAIRKFNIQNL